MSIFKHDTLRSPQLKKKKRRAHSVRALLVAVLFMLAVAGASFLSKHDSMRIATIDVEGNELVSDGEINDIAYETIRGSYWKLFSKQNIFLYPKKAIQKNILVRYPILSGASVEFKNLNAIAIKVVERTPSALLCVLTEGESPFTDECFFMDADGFVYLKAPEFKGNAYFKYYGLLQGNPIGQSFMEAQEYKRLSQFMEGMKELGISPLYIHVRQDGDVESYLPYGGKIIVSMRDDLSVTLVNLEAIIKENIEGENPESSIEYIDLRYGNKVFYKLR